MITTRLQALGVAVAPASFVLVEDDPGEAARRHQRVRRSHPLFHLLPSLAVRGVVERQRDPAVAAEPVAGRIGVRVLVDDGDGLLLRELEAEVLRAVVAEDEVLPVDPERRVITPLLDVDAFGFGQTGDDALESAHVSLSAHGSNGALPI